jgi:hypothetical protein
MTQNTKRSSSPQSTVELPKSEARSSSKNIGLEALQEFRKEFKANLRKARSESKQSA